MIFLFLILALSAREALMLGSLPLKLRRPEKQTLLGLSV